MIFRYLKVIKRAIPDAAKKYEKVMVKGEFNW